MYKLHGGSKIVGLSGQIMNSRDSSKGNGDQRSDNTRTKGTQHREVLEASNLTIVTSRRAGSG